MVRGKDLLSEGCIHLNNIGIQGDDQCCPMCLQEVLHSRQLVEDELEIGVKIASSMFVGVKDA